MINSLSIISLPVTPSGSQTKKPQAHPRGGLQKQKPNEEKGESPEKDHLVIGDQESDLKGDDKAEEKDKEENLIQKLEDIGQPKTYAEAVGRSEESEAVSANQLFPEKIMFVDENNRLIHLSVKYEWKPISCTKCSKLGHEEDMCRKKEMKGNQKLVWKPKITKEKYEQEKEESDVQKQNRGLDTEGNQEGIENQNEGFIPVSKKKAARPVQKWEEEHYHPNGRIWVIWRQQRYEVDIKDASSQTVHCIVLDRQNNNKFHITFVYGLNDIAGRKDMWEKIRSYHRGLKGDWIILGDFNAVLNLNDRIGGNRINEEEISDFKECIMDCGLEEVPTHGSFYTWSNRQGPGRRIYSKLDMVLSNTDWMVSRGMKAYILEEGISDHCPIIIPDHQITDRSKDFKYCDMWTLDPHTKEIIQGVWHEEMEGRPMYKLVKKLKELKSPLRRLNKDKFNEIHKQVEVVKTKLTEVQNILKMRKDDVSLLGQEKELLIEYQIKLKASTLMKNQISKMEWITEGDQGIENTKHFGDCAFYIDICRKLKEEGGCNLTGTKLEGIYTYFMNQGPRKERARMIANWAAVCYMVWRARNTKIHTNRSLGDVVGRGGGGADDACVMQTSSSFVGQPPSVGHSQKRYLDRIRTSCTLHLRRSCYVVKYKCITPLNKMNFLFENEGEEWRRK
ncbi:hypothetical protein DM860_004697 [Cuscuta australis]|uniref:Endonuclease/exonuclease/phosphatase domain-containing protein n=1 Tax=Cuscuta australis TaxID=267555 RepID=A0A328DP32_9ASTE|nr:hypothetical protein DM860_004697 [Cuscuta australis]